MHLRTNAYAASTRRTYLTYLHSFLKFCSDNNIAPVPISSANLGRYIAHLSLKLSFSSLRNYLSVVRILHLEAGKPNPLDSFYISSILKGARRVLGEVSKPKLPITIDILKQVFSCIDLSSPHDICFWAACLVAFFSFFRKSNLLAPSWGHFDPNKHLCRSNIKFGADGVIITVHWSKTIQYSQRSLEIPLPLIPNSPFCPSTALMLLFKSTPCSIQSVPAFVFRQQTATKLMTYDIFVSRLRIFLHKLGYNPSRYSAHSFRRGGASFALQCGLPPDLIQTQGDWRSDVYKTYLDPSLSFRQQVATTLGQAIGKVL